MGTLLLFAFAAVSNSLGAGRELICPWRQIFFLNCGFDRICT